MVQNLFIKSDRGASLVSVAELYFSTDGIRGNVPCPPLRQVLIVPLATLRTYHLGPSDLRENIVLDYDPLHSLSSGTTLAVGEALIRLTFHCEPCNQIKDKVSVSKIAHNRGYLGCFLNEGVIKLNDSASVTDRQHEAIPYNLSERIAWYLDRQSQPVSIKSLLREVGLSLSYARAVPNLLKKLPTKYKDMVMFASSTPNETPNHALQRTATRVTVAADSGLGVFTPSHLSS